ncbi:MAG: DUF1127 domain-containing protein [Paracoccaceae bacterium]|nr:DUF1127 domain-containing protein [Paracoccaceae bacterium]
MIRTETTRRFVPSVSFAQRLLAWVSLARQRRDLARLDADALADIGVTAKDARDEANRPFWDAPENWRI